MDAIIGVASTAANLSRRGHDWTGQPEDTVGYPYVEFDTCTACGLQAETDAMQMADDRIPCPAPNHLSRLGRIVVLPEKKR